MTFKKDKLLFLSDCNQTFEVCYKPLQDGQILKQLQTQSEFQVGTFCFKIWKEI